MNPGLDLVLERSRTLGFLGPGPVADHRRHGRAMVAALRDVGGAGVVVDLGSGGGVPGLEILASLPDVTVVLAERRGRRADALLLAVAELGLRDRGSVWPGDAYDLAWSEHRGRVDAVVARSFGPPPVVVEYAQPLLRPGGWLLVSDVSDEGRWPDGELRQLGLGRARRWESDWFIQGWQREGEGRSDLPRRGTAPRRRPLWRFT